jgi:hypothetical protein
MIPHWDFSASEKPTAPSTLEYKRARNKKKKNKFNSAMNLWILQTDRAMKQT